MPGHPEQPTPVLNCLSFLGRRHNDDWFWTAAADFNTRSSWLGYGVSYSNGQLGGGDYSYLIGYVWARPLRNLALALSSERLENFGVYPQTVLTGTWDVTPRHIVGGRYINAYYGNAYRATYAWRARKNLDLFLVYDHSPGLLAQISAKVVMTY